MSKRDDDIGTWVSFAAVGVFFYWVTEKRSRIVGFLAIVIIGSFLLARLAEKENVERREAYEKRVHVQGLIAQDKLDYTPVIALQHAVIIKQWEEYLASLPAVNSTPAWRASQTAQGPKIDRQEGRLLGRIVTHSDILAFVEGPLTETLGTPLFTQFMAQPHLPFFTDPESAVPSLYLRTDSRGIWTWNGGDYGQRAYKLINPAWFIDAQMQHHLSENSTRDQLLEMATSFEFRFTARKHAALVAAYETNQLSPLIERLTTDIRRRDPQIADDELKRLILKDVQSSVDHRTLLREVPDYRVEDFPFFRPATRDL